MLGFDLLRVLLLEDLVGSCQDRRGDREPESLGGLEVDGEVEPVELFDGQVSRVRAQENALDVLG